MVWCGRGPETGLLVLLQKAFLGHKSLRFVRTCWSSEALGRAAITAFLGEVDAAMVFRSASCEKVIQGGEELVVITISRISNDEEAIIICWNHLTSSLLR